MLDRLIAVAPVSVAVTMRHWKACASEPMRAMIMAANADASLITVPYALARIFDFIS